MGKFKKTTDIGLDYHNRDAPCMLYNGEFYIGNNGSTHATMIQEVIYGMGFEEDYMKLYDIMLNDLDINNNIKFCRNEIDIEDEEIIFGHIKDKNIYWEIPNNITKEMIIKLKIKFGYDKEYQHFCLTWDNKNQYISKLKDTCKY